MDYVDMSKRLERYVRTGTYTYGTQNVPAIEPASTYAIAAVPEDEMRLRLAELAYRVNRSPVGRSVLSLATLRPLADPRPYELLGAVAALEGDATTAADSWEQAVAAGSTNVAILRELALIECRTWFREFDYNLHLPADATARLRTRLLRSIEHEPQQTAAYEMLAWVEAFAEDRSIANVNLVQKQFRTLPKKARTLVGLAMVRVRVGAPAEALKMLQSLEKLDPDLWTAQAAEVISATLEDRPVQKLSDPRGGTAVNSEAGSVIKSSRRLPSVPLPDDL
jgi:hypothetical protein